MTFIFQKFHSLFFFIFALHHTFGQPNPNYGHQSQTKVQLEDIEQDNLKNSQQQSLNQGSSPTQYSQYAVQSQPNQPLVYNFPQQQQQQVVPVTATQQQQQSVGGVPLFSVPQPAAAFAPGTPPAFIYYTQAPQQLSPYELPFYSGSPYVAPQPGQPANLNEYYKSLQTASAVKPGHVAPVSAASLKTVPQVSVPNYYLTGGALQQPYYQSLSFPANSPYLAYNPYFAVQPTQKSVFSAGVKSTTPAVPTKNDEKFTPVGNPPTYRFEYTSPEFAKLRG